jgi:hypothetical protein
MIFPNPVKDKLQVQLNLDRPEAVTVKISDMQGRLVYNKKYNASVSDHDITIDMNAWASHMYILTILDSQNEVITTQKVVKD